MEESEVLFPAETLMCLSSTLPRPARGHSNSSYPNVTAVKAAEVRSYSPGIWCLGQECVEL